MGGRKNKRKTIALVSCVLALAFSVFGIGFFFNNFYTQAIDIEDGAIAQTINATYDSGNLTNSSQQTYNLTFNKKYTNYDPVSYIEVTGARGYNSSYGGKGATMYGFYKGTSLTVTQRGYLGTNSYNGGGATSFTGNFGNLTTSYKVEAGGGGGLAYIGEEDVYLTKGGSITILGRYSSDGKSIKSGYYRGGNAGYKTADGNNGWHWKDSTTIATAGIVRIGAVSNPVVVGQGGQGTTNGADGTYTFWNKTNYYYTTTQKPDQGTEWNIRYGNVYDVNARSAYGGTSSGYPLGCIDYDKVNGYGGCYSRDAGRIIVKSIMPNALPSNVSQSWRGSGWYVNEGNKADASFWGGTLPFSLANGVFYYSLDNKNWYTGNNDNLKKTNIGTYPVYWRYVLNGGGSDNRPKTAASMYNNANYIICSGSYTFSIGSNYSFNASKITLNSKNGAVALNYNSDSTTEIYYNNADINVISKSGLTSVNNAGNIVYAIGDKAYTNGIDYGDGLTNSKNQKLSWDKDITKIKVKNVGTQYLYYRIVSSTDDKDSSKVYRQTIKVIKNTPKINSGKATANSLEYTGEAQTLFSSASGISLSLGAAIEYYTINDGTNKYSSLSDIKATNANTYTLKIKTKATDNLNASGWLDAGTCTIAKATISITASSTLTFNSARTYNGTANAFMTVGDNPIVIKNSKNQVVSNYTTAGNWTVNRVHTANNGSANIDGAKSETVSASNGSQANFKSAITKVNSAMYAGKYELQIACAGGANFNAKTIKLTNSHTINKVTNASLINLKSNFIGAQDPRIGQTEGAQVIYKPTAGQSSNHLSILFKVNNTFTELNGDKLSASSTALNGGTISYCFSKDGTTAPTSGWVSEVSNANMDNKLSSARVGAGTWYLWFKFSAHNNIANSVAIKSAYKVTVKKVDGDSMVLNTNSMQYASSVMFNGAPKKLISDAKKTFALTNTFVKINANSIEYRAWDVKRNAYVENSNWSNDINTVTAVQAGSYQLRARWGYREGYKNASDDVENCNIDGITLAGQFVITKITREQFANKIAFGGLEVNGYDDHGVNKGFVYTGNPISYVKDGITLDDLTIKIDNVEYPKTCISQWFPTLQLALKWDAQMPGNNDFIADGIPTAVNAGKYYLYLYWTESDNVASATKDSPFPYIKNNDRYLLINKAPRERVKFLSVAPLSSAERTFKLVTVKDEYGNDKLESAKIPLFDLTRDNNGTGFKPTIWVLNETDDWQQVFETKKVQSGTTSELIQEIKFQYTLLTTNDFSKIGDAEIEWYDDIDLAVADTVRWNAINTVVQDYYLWIRINNDNNFENGMMLCSGAAELLPQEAYVDERNKPGVTSLRASIPEDFDPDNLVFQEVQLIRPSDQVVPQVQYTLTPDDEESWTTDVTKIQGKNPGDYYVFIRGYCAPGGNFTTQQPYIGGDGRYNRAWNDSKFLPDEYGEAQYRFVHVVIQEANITIASAPVALDITYTGKPQMLFTRGSGTFGGAPGQPLLYSFEPTDPTKWFRYEQFEQWYTHTSLDADMGYADKYYWELTNDEVKAVIKINAGEYTVYYKLDANLPSTQNIPQSLTLTIKKAKVTRSQFSMPSVVPTTDQENSVFDRVYYNSQPHCPFDGDSLASFTINGMHNYDKIPEGKGEGFMMGVPGVVKYGYSTNYFTPPTIANTFNTWESVGIVNAGTYYMWIQVEEGENHEASGWICVHNNKDDHPYIILPARPENIELSWSEPFDHTTIYYNGLNVALVTSGSLVQTCVEKDIEGNVINELGTLELADSKKALTIWYAITESQSSPDANDIRWQTNYLNAVVSEVNNSGYYLHVKVARHSNAGQIIGCVNPNEPLYLQKAPEDTLAVRGITFNNQMFQGKPLNLAGGMLNDEGEVIFRIDTINASDPNITYMFNVEHGMVRFMYWPYGDKEHAPKSTSNWPEQEGLSYATATNAGTYYLWAYITNSKNLNDSIVCVNPTAPVVITPANETYVEICAPELLTVSEYDAVTTGKKLILSDATLAMKNGGDLGAHLGTAYYYIRDGQNNMPPDQFKTVEGVRTVADGWVVDRELICRADVNVYQIFVMFISGGSECNHTDLSPVWVGEVRIEQASESITFGGFEYKVTDKFNGGELPLLTSESILNMYLGEIEIPSSSYEWVKFAWSSSAEVLPNISDYDWVDDLTDVVGVTAGPYYIWAWVKDNDTNIAEFRRCIGADSEGNEYAAILQRDNTDTVTVHGVNYANTLVYDGTNRHLALFDDFKIKIGGNIITSNMLGAISWAITEGKTAGEEPDEDQWVSDINELVKRDANLDEEYYWVWIKITATDNIRRICRPEREIFIKRATITVTDIEGASDLVYNGSAQILLSAEKHGVSNFGEIVYRLEPNGRTTEDARSEWHEWNEIVGTEAYNNYEVYYAVLQNRNWDAYTNSVDRIVIKPAKATLIDLPKAKFYVAYTGEKQDLIDFGKLEQNAIDQGVKIVFRYQTYVDQANYRDENNSEYSTSLEYTYLGDGVWDDIYKKLPGGLNAGRYIIKYYTTASTQMNSLGSYNYEASNNDADEGTIEIIMQRRMLVWYEKPTAKENVKNIGELQPIINPGLISADHTQGGGRIEYARKTTDTFDTIIPTATGIGFHFSYFHVVFDARNNYFYDGNRYYAQYYDYLGYVYGSDDTPYEITTENEELVTFIEKLTVSIRDLPQAVHINYDGLPHYMVFGGRMSTEVLPGDYPLYLEYSYNQETWYREFDLPQKDEVGDYPVYYRVHYSDIEINPDTYEFIGADHGVVYSSIDATVVEGSSIRAVLIDEENYIADFVVEDDDEEGTLKQRLLDDNAVTIYYRLTGDFNWYPWEAFRTEILNKNKFGPYEIKASIKPGAENFTPYEQPGNYYGFIFSRPLIINVHFDGGYSYRPNVRAWLDSYGGPTTYATAESKYKTPEGAQNPLRIDFCDLSGSGFSLKIDCGDNDKHYYYISESQLTDYQKLHEIELSDALVNHMILETDIKLETDVYIYEVYRIAYDANGGSGNPIKAGWKWHSRYTGEDCEYPYKITDAVFTHPAGLLQDSWNISSSGSSDERYNSSNQYYTENRSVTLYAQYNSSSQLKCLVHWKINNYKITGSGTWFNYIDNPNRNNVGIEVVCGEQIYLPDINNVPTNANGTGGKFILKWVVEGEEDSSEYSWGMKAPFNRESITFVPVFATADAYVNCVFMDTGKNAPVSSVIIADGAEGYMAFSGLTEKDFKRYDYEQFIDELTGKGQTIHLDGEDRVKIFNLGAENVVNEDDEKEEIHYQTQGEITTMIVIIGLGATLAGVILVMYIVLRNKNNNKVKSI